MSEPTDETAGPDLVTERFTSGGPGPEGQPDTVNETPSPPEPVEESAPEAEADKPKSKRGKADA